MNAYNNCGSFGCLNRFEGSMWLVCGCIYLYNAYTRNIRICHLNGLDTKSCTNTLGVLEITLAYFGAGDCRAEIIPLRPEQVNTCVGNVYSGVCFSIL